MRKNIDLVIKRYQDALIKENSKAIHDMLIEVRNSITGELVPWNLCEPKTESHSMHLLFCQFKGIRENINLPDSDEIQRKIYYAILEKWQYNMRYEVLDAIRLCRMFFYCLQELKAQTVIKQRIKNSIEIDEVSIENGNLLFSTVNFGEITIGNPSMFFKEEDGFYSLLSETWQTKCHIATEEILKADPKLIAITFLSPYILKGSFIHSVAYDPVKDLIIDLANDMIVRKSEYFNLFEPVIINSLDYNQYNNELSNFKDVFSENDKTYSLVKSAYLKRPDLFEY